MPTYTVHQAKTNLSKLLAEAEAGEEVIIARGDKPAVRLTPIGAAKPKRQFGAYKGCFDVPASFWEPLPEEELRLWTDSPIFPESPPAPATAAALDASADKPKARRRSRA